MVGPKVPESVRTLRQFADWAKAQPEPQGYASPAAGAMPHFLGNQFARAAGVALTHLPYRGAAPGLQDLMGGQVQYMFDNMISSWPHVQNGKLRALAVTTKKRSASAPDVPTMEESGVAPFDVTSWFGLVAPAGTPKAAASSSFSPPPDGSG